MIMCNLWEEGLRGQWAPRGGASPCIPSVGPRGGALEICRSYCVRLSETSLLVEDCARTALGGFV